MSTGVEVRVVDELGHQRLDSKGAPMFFRIEHGILRDGINYNNLAVQQVPGHPAGEIQIVELIPIANNHAPFLPSSVAEVVHHTSPQTVKKVVDQTVPQEFVWSREATVFLISCISEHQSELYSSYKKPVWVKIANMMMTERSDWSGISWSRVESKWKSLKRTYKSVKEHNSSSGRGRQPWEFMQQMDEILAHRPEITPVATCSSRSSQLPTSTLENIDPNAIPTPIPKRKRKADEPDPIEEGKNRRHKDRMSNQNRFLDLMEQLVNKM